MKKISIVLFIVCVIACKEQKENTISAQEIVDKSIALSGGDAYKTSTISFRFRDREYRLEKKRNRSIMSRLLSNDTISILDVKEPSGLKRFVNDSLVPLSDSLANVYANSVNAVHYFAYLPYGLNDKAVIKELIGEVRIKDRDYYKLKVTFKQEGGGKDFEDVYVYWFNKETYKADYLAYEYHVDGGGVRFREAYNERYVSGIRFVDYINYSPLEKASVLRMDSIYIQQKMKLLSKIELEQIKVIPN